MASQLSDLLQKTAVSLRADPRLVGVNVSIHGGNFTDVELRAYGAKAPHIVLAMLRADLTLQGGAPTASVGMVAVVIEADRPGAGADRHTRALALTDAALRVLSRLFAGGMDGISKPRDMTARNLFSREWDRTGIAAWALSWVQTVILTDSTSWDIFATLDTKYDITPRDNDAPLGQVPDAEDIIDLT